MDGMDGWKAIALSIATSRGHYTVAVLLIETRVNSSLRLVDLKLQALLRSGRARQRRGDASLTQQGGERTRSERVRGDGVLYCRETEQPGDYANLAGELAFPTLRK